MPLVKPKLSSAPQVPTKGAHGHQKGCLYFRFKPLNKEGVYSRSGPWSTKAGAEVLATPSQTGSLVSWVSWWAEPFCESVSRPGIEGLSVVSEQSLPCPYL